MAKATQTQSGSEPMTLDNMRHLGVQRLIASCLNDACRHQGLIDVSKYPDDIEVRSFAGKVVYAKCGARWGISMCGRLLRPRLRVQAITT